MYLLDTNICIYIIKNRPPQALKKLKTKLVREIAVSSITVAELAYGVAKSAQRERNTLALMEFLSPFAILAFDDRDAAEYGRSRAVLEKAGKTVGPMDLLIAAQAKARRLVLVTNNTGEFERIEDLEIENWAAG